MLPRIRSSDSEFRPHGTGPSILVVDDDRAIRLLLYRELTAADYRVESILPRRDVVAFLANHPFDLVMLDVDASVSKGAEVIRSVRKISPAPILALAVHAGEDNVAQVLEAGADDFIRKPFGIKELLARVHSALRRRVREQGGRSVIVCGDLTIDLARHRVQMRGCDVHLPPKSFEVLRLLAENAGRVLSHREILTAVWGGDRVVPVAYLRLTIRDLRRNLEADPEHPKLIRTEVRIGYCLDLEAQP